MPYFNLQKKLKGFTPQRSSILITNREHTKRRYNPPVFKMSTITSLINKAQGVLDMNKDDMMSAENTVKALTKLINEMAKDMVKTAEISDGEKSESESKSKSKSKSKKADTETDSDAAPKEKRPANKWTIFTSRVNNILKENSAPLPGAEQKQFCSHLSTIKHYTEWEDEDKDEILAERAKWVKPEMSKQEAAGKNKTSRKSSRRSSVAEESEKPEVKKAEEVKEKKVEVKEKKKPGRPKKVVEEKEKEKEKKAEPEKKKAGRPKKEVKKVEEVEDESDEVDFEGFEYEGTLYLKSKEGYLLDIEGNWVGLFNGETVDEDAEEPEKVKEYRVMNFKD